ncbi:MAG TPA: hypothetical protein PLN33_20025 [Hyphomonadaceae bacterium]|nr:hypothetical protein [Hyphomonadaceae bacterium]
MAERLPYRPNFSAAAAEFIISLPKRRQGLLMSRAYELARYPFIESDYQVVDSDGRSIEHLLVDGTVFAYWVDHAARLVMITEIEDAD